MMRTSYYCALALLGAMALANSAFAQVAMQPTMSYQGLLTSSTGTPLTGTHTMTIRLYSDPAGGTPVWTETQTVTLNQGLFNVILGKTAPLAVAFNRQYWLGVSVDGAAEMNPRTELAAVPYSLHSRWSDSTMAVMPGSINASSIANGSITLNKLSTTGASNGQVLTFTSGGLQWLTPAAGGGVSSINGLTGPLQFVGSGGTNVTQSGNTITINSTTGGSAGVSSITSEGPIWVVNPTGPTTTLGLVTGGINGSHIANNSITGAHIVNNTITDEDINNVSFSKITGVPSLTPSGPAGGVLAGTYPNPTHAIGGVTTNAIANGAVTDEKITSVSYSKVTGAPTTMSPSGTAGGSLMGTYPNPTIAPNAVGSSEIANNAVTTVDLANGSVTTDIIADGAVTDAKITSVSYSKVTGAPTTMSPSGAAGGDLTGTYPNPTVTSNAIGSAEIINGSIMSEDLANNAVATNNIADGAVTDPKIMSVSYSKVTGAPATMPPSGAAGGDLTGTYPNPTVTSNAIGSAEIINGSIISEDLANSAVTTTKLDATGAATGQSLMFNGTTVVWGNATAGGFTLPFAGTTNSSSTAFSVTNTGTGGAGLFAINNAANNTAALTARTNGTGPAADLYGGLHVHNGTIFAEGTTGTTPVSGAGTRLMWVPSAAAFRAGCVTGNQWDAANLGSCSFATGNNTVASGRYSFAGGDSARATGSTSLAFGVNTSAQNTGAIALGGHTVARGGYAMAFGNNASATGDYAMALGYAPLADGAYTIAAGFHARSCGLQSQAWGRFAESSGNYSFAFGNSVSTNMKEGALIFGDNSTETVLRNTAMNQFMVRAAGGVIFYTDSGATCGVQLTPGCGGWAVVSDRNKKANFRPEDGESILGKIAEMPILSWNYKTQDASIRHIGPMAQDFYAAFKLGSDDTTITSTDIDGINLLAVQALERRTTELRAKVAELEQLRANYDMLNKQNQDLVAQIESLKVMVEMIAAERTPQGDRPVGDLRESEK